MAKRIPIRERINLRILGEAFNVQNRVNYQDVNTTWGTTIEPREMFGRFQGAGNPRQIQLGVKFDF